MKIVKSGYRILWPVTDADWISEARDVEAMGRICYKSEDKIMGDSYDPFIRMLVSNGHEAMLEHSVMKVIFTCDRGVSHEIVQHRLCAFAQESTRYCNYSKDKFCNEITVIEPLHLANGSAYDDSWQGACLTAEQNYLQMIQDGVSPQMARSVLPNSLKTEIGVTANFREWRHIFKLRAISKAAHPQMRELMIPLYEECRQKLPCVFDMGVLNDVNY